MPQGYLVLRNRFTYVKDFSFWMPEFIRDITLFPNKNVLQGMEMSSEDKLCPCGHN